MDLDSLVPPSELDAKRRKRRDIEIQRKLWSDKMLVTTANGEAICNVDNAVRCMEFEPGLKEAFYFSDFANRVKVNYEGSGWRQFDDNDLASFLLFFQREQGLFKISGTTVFNAILARSLQIRRHEVRDWLQSLVWDHVPRLGIFFSRGYGCEQDEYHRKAGLNFLISLVARIMRPGCKSDVMVILEGAQGLLKSTSLRKLVSDPWFAEINSDLDSKDFMECMQGKWLLECGELDKLLKADSEAVKRALSCQSDYYRVSFGRIANDHPRQCIIAGSTNKDNYLTDQTGGRRFIPIACKNIDIDWIQDNRSQLFAEALVLFEQNVSWWEMPVVEALEAQEARRQIDPWEELIGNFIANLSSVSVNEILHDCLVIDKGKRLRSCQMTVTSILRDRFHWWKKKDETVRPKVWRWYPPKY